LKHLPNNYSLQKPDSFDKSTKVIGTFSQLNVFQIQIYSNTPLFVGKLKSNTDNNVTLYI